MDTLKAWLESHGCYDVAPVRVTIGRTTYQGCEYLQNSNHGGFTYTVQAIYLLASEIPSCARGRKVCFTRERDARDWYIAGGSGRFTWGKGRFWQEHKARCERDKEGQARHEPFGPAFYLHPWPEGDAIDRYEERPYRRVQMKVQEG